MGRIGTNVPAAIAVNNLFNSQAELSDTLERLSSGLRINSAGDDPSGMIISELLRSELAGIEEAIANSERAGNVLATAEGALNEVSALLVRLRQLVVEAANSGTQTDEELAATQLEIDSAVRSIARIADATTFGGRPLLNGTFAYSTSGVTASQIVDHRIFAAQFDGADRIPVTVEVTAQAEKAVLEFSDVALGASGLTMELTGNRGTEVLRFAASAPVAVIALAVNDHTEATGVSAVLSMGSLFFVSVDYGSDQFVSVTALEGTFDLTAPGVGPATRNTGSDIEGLINGVAAAGRGTTLSLNTNSLDLSVKMDPAFSGSTVFAVTGGGMLFQLGPRPAANQQFSIGIDSIDPGSLGERGLGFLTDIATGGDFELADGNFTRMEQIIDKANEIVMSLRGRLGAFATNTVESNLNSLSIAVENVASTQSVIRDADFAVETANLTRSQILVQAGVSVLATANSMPQTILSLLQ